MRAHTGRGSGDFLHRLALHAERRQIRAHLNCAGLSLHDLIHNSLCLFVCQVLFFEYFMDCFFNHMDRLAFLFYCPDSCRFFYIISIIYSANASAIPRKFSTMAFPSGVRMDSG